MTKYTLVFYSKDEQSINHFLKFLKDISKTQNFQIFKKLLKKSKTKKKISILKSPHVNKTAQEQFEYIYYSGKISFYSWEVKKYFIILKKIKTQLFPDINLKMEVKTCLTKKKKLLNLNKIIFNKPIIQNKNQKQNMKNIPLQFFVNKNKLKNTLFYLKTLDYYGEF